MVFHLVILQKLPCVVGTLPHIHEIDGHGRDAGLAVSAQRPVGKRGNIQIFRNPQPVLLTVADEAEGDIVVGADHGVKILPFLPEGFKALIHTLTVEKDRVIRIGAPSGVQIALEDFTAHQIVDTALAAGHQRDPFLFAGNQILDQHGGGSPAAGTCAADPRAEPFRVQPCQNDLLLFPRQPQKIIPQSGGLISDHDHRSVRGSVFHQLCAIGIDFGGHLFFRRRCGNAVAHVLVYGRVQALLVPENRNFVIHHFRFPPITRIFWHYTTAAIR